MPTRNWIIIAAIVLVMIAGIMLFGGDGDDPDTTVTSPPEAPPAAVPRAEPETSLSDREPAPEDESAPPPEPVPQLPALGESDPFVRERATPLMGEGPEGELLAPDQLVRRLVAVVENLAQGRVLREQLGDLAPDEGFPVERRDGTYYLDPDGYDRYDRVANVVASLDPQQTVQFLEGIEPLLTDAWAELGVQDVEPESRIVDAIDVLLATPEPDYPLRLRRPHVLYEFADPALEDLQPAQKQLLRMGPENMAKIKDQLREVRAVLAR